MKIDLSNNSYWKRTLYREWCRLLNMWGVFAGLMITAILGTFLLGKWQHYQTIESQFELISMQINRLNQRWDVKNNQLVDPIEDEKTAYNALQALEQHPFLKQEQRRLQQYQNHPALLDQTQLVLRQLFLSQLNKIEWQREPITLIGNYQASTWRFKHKVELNSEDLSELFAKLEKISSFVITKCIVQKEKRIEGEVFSVELEGTLWTVK